MLRSVKKEWEVHKHYVLENARRKSGMVRLLSA